MSLIQRLFAQANFPVHITVGTIHQIQGQQADIVIVDTTVVEHLHRNLLCLQTTTANGAQLLNVAMTRAQSKLIMVAKSQLSKSSLRPHFSAIVSKRLKPQALSSQATPYSLSSPRNNSLARSKRKISNSRNS